MRAIEKEELAKLLYYIQNEYNVEHQLELAHDQVSFDEASEWCRDDHRWVAEKLLEKTRIAIKPEPS